MFDKVRSLAGATFLYALGVTFIVLFFFASFKDTAAAALYWVIVAMCFGGGAFLTVQYVKAAKRDPNQNTAKKRQKQFDKLTLEYNKTPASEIDVKQTDYGDFIFVGSFDLGEPGALDYRKVHVDVTADELKERYGTSFDGAAAQKYVYELVTSFQAELKKYSRNLKNYFLSNMIREADMSGSGFWDSYRLNADEYDDDKCTEIFEAWHEKVFAKHFDGAQDISLRDDPPIDIESELKAHFPFFDYDRFIGGIVLDDLHISADSIAIQLSDELGEVFCGAYDEFDRDLTPSDWHNF